MRRITVLLTILSCFVLSLALVQCGNGGGEDKGGEGQPCLDDGTCNTGLHCMQSDVCQGEVSLSEFASEAAALNCAWLFSCCSAEELSEIEVALQNTTALDDEASCRTFFTPVIDDNYSTPAQNAIDASRGTYYPDKSASCLAEAAALTCTSGGDNALTQMLNICDDSYVGSQGEGDECAHQVECSSGHQCVEDTCQAPLAENTACSTDPGSHLCSEDLYCHTIDLTCQQRIAPGEDCPGLSELECQTGYKCDETSTCVERTFDTCTGL